MALSTTPLTTTASQDTIGTSVANAAGATSSTNYTILGALDQLLAGGNVSGTISPLSTVQTALAALVGQFPSGVTGYNGIPDAWRQGILTLTAAIAVAIRQAFETHDFATSGALSAQGNVTSGSAGGTNAVVATAGPLISGANLGSGGIAWLQQVYTVAQLPAPAVGNVGQIRITSNGGPINTASVGSNPPTFTQNTGAPGIVFCAFNGVVYHWYNTIGFVVV